MTQEKADRKWVSVSNLAKKFQVRPVTIRAWAKRAGAEIRPVNQRLHMIDETSLLEFIENQEPK